MFRAYIDVRVSGEEKSPELEQCAQLQSESCDCQEMHHECTSKRPLASVRAAVQSPRAKKTDVLREGRRNVYSFRVRSCQ